MAKISERHAAAYNHGIFCGEYGIKSDWRDTTKAREATADDGQYWYGKDKKALACWLQGLAYGKSRRTDYVPGLSRFRG